MSRIEDGLLGDLYLYHDILSLQLVLGLVLPTVKLHLYPGKS